jgi:hypothetical protein
MILQQVCIDPGDGTHQQHIHSLQLRAGNGAAIRKADFADGAKYFLNGAHIVISQYSNVSIPQLL